MLNRPTFGGHINEEGFFFESLTTQMTSGYDYAKLFKSNSSLPQNGSMMVYLCGQPLGQEI